MKWISVKDKMPDKKEPVVYATKKGVNKFHVGIAYWTASEKWKPEAMSEYKKEGFTHWMPLPSPPEDLIITDKCRWENASFPDYTSDRAWRVGCKNIFNSKGYDYISELNAVYVYCPYCAKKIQEVNDV